jgi:hypothetical protein
MKFINLKKNKEYYIFYFSKVDELKTFSALFDNWEDNIYYKPPKLYKAKFNQIVGNLTQSHIMLDFYKSETLTYDKKIYECNPQLQVGVLFPEKVEKESQRLGDNILCSRGDWIIAEDKQTIKQILRNIYKATTSYTAHKDKEGHIYYTRSTIYVTKKTRENYQEAIKTLKYETV